MNDWQRELDEELTDMQFTSNRSVLKKVYGQTKKDKCYAFLNREISFPVFPVTVVMVIFFFMIYATIPPITNPADQGEERVIEKAGSFYWEQQWKELKHRAY